MLEGHLQSKINLGRLHICQLNVFSLKISKLAFPDTTNLFANEVRKGRFYPKI